MLETAPVEKPVVPTLLHTWANELEGKKLNTVNAERIKVVNAFFIKYYFK